MLGCGSPADEIDAGNTIVPILDARSDARVPDSRPGTPDARPTPDSPALPDARPTPDAVPVPDARPVPDAVPPCTNAGCGDGHYCGQDNQCHSCSLTDPNHCGDPGAAPGCDVCTGGTPTCDTGFCVCTGAGNQDTCKAGLDGLVCTDGTCGQCTTSSQCPSGQCCGAGTSTCGLPLTWLRTPPEPRSGHVAIFDAASQRMIVLGGGYSESTAIQYAPGPWAFSLPTDGSPVHPEPLFPTGTGPRRPVNLKALYDDGPLGPRAIVFGGDPYPGNTGPTGLTDDVWALDLPPGGTPSWSLLSLDEGPEDLRGWDAVVDTKRQRVIFFDSSWEMWTLSLTSVRASWDRLDHYDAPNDSGPAIYDPAGDRLVAWDGQFVFFLPLGGSTTPEWQLAFPEVSAGAPANLDTATAIYDPVGARMLLHVLGQQGGHELWALSLPASGSPAWTKIGADGLAAIDPSVVYDSSNQQLVMFGGYSCPGLTCVEYNSVYGLSLGAPALTSLLWQASPSPGPIQGASAVYDSAQQRMLVYDGDVWSMTLPADDVPVWQKLVPVSQNSPPSRSGQAMILDAAKQRVILYGGFTYGVPDDTYYGDLWQLSLPPGGGTPVWTSLGAANGYPGQRTEMASAYDAKNEHMVVFGGYGYTYAGSGLAIAERNDVSIVDLSTGQPYFRDLQPTGTPPDPRRGATAVYDPIGQRLIVTGGRRFDSTLQHDVYYDDLWALSLPASGNGEWTQLVAGTGYGVANGAAVYDPIGQRMLIMGGTYTYYGPLGDVVTSYYNGVGEYSLASGPTVNVPLDPLGQAPGPRAFPAAIFDVANDRMVIYGGYGGYTMHATYDDVWMATVEGCQ